MDGRACTLDELIEDAKRLADSMPTHLSVTKTCIGKAEPYTVSPTPIPTLEHTRPSSCKSSARNAFPATSVSPLKTEGNNQTAISEPDLEIADPLFVEEGPADLIGKEAPQKVNLPTIPKRGVAVTKTITSPKGVYYKYGPKGERVPVAVGDLVVRVQKEAEKETEDNNK